MHTLENIQQPSLLAVQSHSLFTTLTDGRLEGLELMHTLDAKINWGERERGPLLWTQRTRCHAR